MWRITIVNGARGTRKVRPWLYKCTSHELNMTLKEKREREKRKGVLWAEHAGEVRSRKPTRNPHTHFTFSVLIVDEGLRNSVWIWLKVLNGSESAQRLLVAECIIWLFKKKSHKWTCKEMEEGYRAGAGGKIKRSLYSPTSSTRAGFGLYLVEKSNW